MPIPPADVTVVVPTFNRARDLPETLRAVARGTVVPRAAIVVDNSSTDDTAAIVAALAPELATAGCLLGYLVKEPQGPAAARNLGWREATTRFVAFVDSDVTLAPDWLAVTLAALDQEPALGAVGGRVLYAHRPDLLNGFGGAIGPIGLAWDAHEGEPAAATLVRTDVLWTNCSALLVRRDALRAIGGFDEAFFYGYEDSDLGWRLTLAGWRVAVLPDASVLHRVGTAIGDAAAPILFHASKNRLRSVLVNWGTARLLVFGPAAIGYSLADLLLRRPRGPRARALLWNLARLGDTIARRRQVQATRTLDDRWVAALFAARWFPARRLGGLRRRAPDRDGPAERIADDRV